MINTYFRAFENDDEDLNNSGEGSTPETPVVPVAVPEQGSNIPGNLVSCTLIYDR